MDSKKINTIKNILYKIHDKEGFKSSFRWLNSEQGQLEIEQEMEQSWNSFEFDQNIDIDSKKIFAAIKDDIGENKPRRLRLNLKLQISIAAAIFIVLGVVGMLNFPSQEILTESIEVNPICDSIYVDNGKRTRITLPDSSIVWLNSGTKINYSYSENSRDIYLDGQAFFEVTRNENTPFLVHSKGLLVKVLGTKFDVCAYSENKTIDVVLESGSVQLLNKNSDTFDYKLKPGEQANFDITSEKVNIHEINVETYTSWRNDVLIFNNEPLRTVIDKLQRWYNIKIEVIDKNVYASHFTGKIEYEEEFENIIELIEFSCSVDFVVKKSASHEAIPTFLLSIN